MSNVERPIGETLYRRKELIRLSLSVFERAVLFPFTLHRSLEKVPDEVRSAYEQYRQEIAEIFGENTPNADYIYHGTGLYNYLSQEDHKYEAGGTRIVSNLLEKILTNGLEPQTDVWIPTPARSPTVSLTPQRFYARWYSDRHNFEDPLWSYGDPTDWAFSFAVKSVRRFLDIPYTLSIIRSCRKTKPGGLGLMQRWVSDVRDDTDPKTSYLNVCRSKSTIPGNHGVIIVIKRDGTQLYDSPLIKSTEKRSLRAIAADNFVALEVPLRQVDQTKTLLEEMGRSDIRVLPMECVDLHLSQFPLRELMRIDDYESAKPKPEGLAKISFPELSHDELMEVGMKASPFDLMTLLSKSPLLGTLLSQVSNWEGFSVGYHTLCGLMLFDKYFQHVELPSGVSREFFRIFYALHDIGDSLGRSTADKLAFNQRISTEFFTELGFNERETALARGLLSDDPLGSYLKKTGVLVKVLSHFPQMVQVALTNLLQEKMVLLRGEAVGGIQAMADVAGMNYSDFFKLLTLFHMIDAGAYTSEGGTLGTLNYVFDFDPNSGTMDYSPVIKPLITQLAQ